MKIEKTKIAIALAVFAGLFAATCALAGGKGPKRALYVGEGSAGNGTFKWIRLLGKDGDFTPVDADAIRAGAIDGASALVVGDGDEKKIAAALGAEGAAKIREAVSRGLGYVGAGAGAALACQADGGGFLSIVPYAVSKEASHGEAYISFSFNEEAENALGVAQRQRTFRFRGRPVLEEGRGREMGDFREIAVFNSDISLLPDDTPPPSLIGRTAALVGSFGKGRVAVSCMQAEDDASKRKDVAAAMFSFAANGLKPKAVPGRHKLGNLIVGISSDFPLGVEGAKFTAALMDGNGFDAVPVSRGDIFDGKLRTVDVLVFPPSAKGEGVPPGTYDDAETNELKAFVEHGGAIVNGFDMAKLRKIRSTPPVVPQTEKPPKAKNALKVAIYRDKGVSDDLETRLIDSCPEFDVRHVSGADIADGALDGFDMLVHAGGGGETQYKALGSNGVENVKNFIRQGGLYHGTCAGAFLVIEPTRRKRIHAIPYRPDDPAHFRGGAKLYIDLTDDGMPHLGTERRRLVYYHGGPAMVKSKDVEGASFKTFAEYSSHVVSTQGPHSDMLSMRGKAAMVAGTYGKGKMFICGPHPEGDPLTDDLYFRSLEWLAGRKVHPAARWHLKGAPNISVISAKRSVEGGNLVKKLFWLKGTNRQNGLGETVDAVVLVDPDKRDYDKAPGAGSVPLFVLAAHPKAVEPPEGTKKARVFKSAEALAAALAEHFKIDGSKSCL